jgi:hypothetical protein
MDLGDPCRIEVGRESMLHAETAAANRHKRRHSTAAETSGTQNKSWTAWIADSDMEIKTAMTRQGRAANIIYTQAGSMLHDNNG